MTIDDNITELAGKAIDARLALADAIRDACPKPHAYVQHRDGQPPWCHTCGRGEMGTRYGKPAAAGHQVDMLTRAGLLGATMRAETRPGVAECGSEPSGSSQGNSGGQP